MAVLAAVLCLCGAALGSTGSISVAGGEPVTPGSYSWPAALFVRGRASDSDRFVCSGTLVTPARMLTAAHCVVGGNPEKLEVRVGAFDLNSGLGEVDRVVRIASRPGFRLQGVAAVNDVAVVELARPLSAAPLPIVPAGTSATLSPGTPVRVLGWGLTSDEDEVSPNAIRQVDLKLLEDRRCSRAYGHAYHPGSQLCVGGAPGRGACHGDSGGPLLLADGAGGWRELGVVSGGRSCLTDRSPQVFSDLSVLGSFARNPSPSYAPFNRRPPMIRGGRRRPTTLRCLSGRWQGEHGAFRYRWVRNPGRHNRSVPHARAARLRLGESAPAGRYACQVSAASRGGSSLAESAPRRVR